MEHINHSFNCTNIKKKMAEKTQPKPGNLVWSKYLSIQILMSEMSD